MSSPCVPAVARFGPGAARGVVHASVKARHTSSVERGRLYGRRHPAKADRSQLGAEVGFLPKEQAPRALIPGSVPLAFPLRGGQTCP